MEPLQIRQLNRDTYHPQGMKMCTRCENIKPRTDEYFVVSRALKTKGKDRHKGYCKECDKKRRAIQKDKLKKDPEHYFNRLIASLRYRAKEIGVPFNITGKQLYNKWISQKGECYWLGEKMDFQSSWKDKSRPGDNFVSIDRVIPILGYIDSNIVLCSWKMNKLKNDMKGEDFIKFCRKVTERFS